MENMFSPVADEGFLHAAGLSATAATLTPGPREDSELANWLFNS